MKKNILLAVTGMSPQVVTETLYAIYREQLPWPDEIRVITTQVGKQHLASALIEKGYLATLCRDYGLPFPEFTEDSILATPGANGEAVADARTLEDHEALANFITEEVRNLTAEGMDTAIHASLAGGRKTMTFYLGYAMSLFGRRQDRLSHVLVTQDFENNPEFFYPTPEPHIINSRGGEPLDCSTAEVVLADIPFIRHRQYLPKAFHHLRTGLKFRDVISLINLGTDPQDLRVRLDDVTFSIQVCDSDGQVFSVIDLGLADYALYRMLLRDNQEGRMEVVRPESSIGDTDLAYEYLRDVFVLVQKPYDDSATLEELLDVIADENELNPTGLDNRSVRTLRKGMKDSYLSQRINSIGQKFTEQITETLCDLIQPRLIWDTKHSRKVTQEELDAEGKSKLRAGAAYCFMLPLAQFQIMRSAKSRQSGY